MTRQDAIPPKQGLLVVSAVVAATARCWCRRRSSAHSPRCLPPPGKASSPCRSHWRCHLPSRLSAMPNASATRRSGAPDAPWSTASRLRDSGNALRPGPCPPLAVDTIYLKSASTHSRTDQPAAACQFLTTQQDMHILHMQISHSCSPLVQHGRQE